MKRSKYVLIAIVLILIVALATAISSWKSVTGNTAHQQTSELVTPSPSVSNNQPISEMPVDESSVTSQTDLPSTQGTAGIIKCFKDGKIYGFKPETYSKCPSGYTPLANGPGSKQSITDKSTQVTVTPGTTSMPKPTTNSSTEPACAYSKTSKDPALHAACRAGLTFPTLSIGETLSCKKTSDPYLYDVTVQVLASGGTKAKFDEVLLKRDVFAPELNYQGTRPALFSIYVSLYDAKEGKVLMMGNDFNVDGRVTIANCS